MLDYANKVHGDTEELCPWHRGVLLVSDFKGKRVLDIGCGSGAFLKSIQNDAEALLGLDPNPINIAAASKHGIDAWNEYFSSELHSRLSLFRPSVITCFEVIEHIYSPMELFGEARSLLQESGGGIFIVSTPNAFNIRRSLSFVFNQKHHDPMMDPTRFDEPEHIRAYSFGMLKNALIKTGFTAVKGYGIVTSFGSTRTLKFPAISKQLGQNLLMVASI